LRAIKPARPGRGYLDCNECRLAHRAPHRARRDGVDGRHTCW
jgi:hypothetical protein